MLISFIIQFYRRIRNEKKKKKKKEVKQKRVNKISYTQAMYREEKTKVLHKSKHAHSDTNVRKTI